MRDIEEVKRAFYWEQVKEPYTQRQLDAYFDKLLKQDDQDTDEFWEYVEYYYERIE